MKKYFLFLCLSLFIMNEGNSQCTPVDCPSSPNLLPFGGICETAIPQGLVNTSYTEEASFRLTNVCFNPADFDPDQVSQVIRILNVFGFSFSGLPAGMTAATNQSSYSTNPSPVIGCAGISGTPTEAGLFAVNINVTGTIRTWLIGGCNGIIPIDLQQPFSFALDLEILPDASFTGLEGPYCELDAPVTLTPTGTPGGTFSGPGVVGNTFDPSLAGPGSHTITYTVSAQQGASVGPAANTSPWLVSVVGATPYYADTDVDGFGDFSNVLSTCSTAPPGYVADNTDCDDSDASIFPGAPELCNGIDDDCDGGVDEGFDVDGDGWTTCGGDCDDGNASINPSSTEVCNGIDDDCDGGVDEGFDVDGDGWTTCGGDCDDGNASINPSSTEVCNGIDDDCDGGVDEGFDVDGDGWTTCGGDCDDGNASINPSSTEVCNGIDDDCDGGVDEGFDVDGDGWTTCGGDCDDADASIFPGAPELCDGVDNDCDGAVDEDFALLGTACSVGVGACQNEGIMICNPAGTGLVCSAVPGTPSVEICDGLDNDCDGSVDEDFPTLGSPCFAGVGECQREGVIVCDPATGEAICNIQPGPPSAEVCDGLDNNCDGAVDEGLSVDADLDGFYAIGSCLTPATDCDDDNADVFPGAPELCDGVDNDCDGAVDEDFALLGTACSVGVGACQNEGIMICNPAGTGLVCSAVPGTPSVEICDGLDNDCDGVVDNGDPGGGAACDGVDSDQCEEGVLVCQNGVLICSDNTGNSVEICDGLDNDCDGIIPSTEIDDDGDGQSECEGDCDDSDATIFSGAPELCDGIDNDCDGAVDEDFALLGTACSVGVGQCQNEGIMICNPAGTGLVCSAVPGTPSVEICDGIDNDCDGVVDNGNPGGGAACDGIDSDQCEEGVLVCQNGVLICSDNTGNSVEICDGLDNDCDGIIPSTEIDDDGDGQSECEGDCDDSDATIFSGAPELCDGIDNDCDGAVDEDFPQLGQVCVVGTGECQRVGIMVCDPVSGGVVCSVQSGSPTPEICDGLDNNCDGVIDEGDPGGGAACDGVDSDQCEEGVLVCQGGVLICSDNTGDNVEICDGIDNDCDGVIDNGVTFSDYWPDSDADGYGDDAAGPENTCDGPPPGFVNNKDDCDDSNSDVFPGAPELCDGLDNDCDGALGSDEIDNDSDGFTECDGDCDDADNNNFPGNPEVCDGLDNDCDGVIDNDVTFSDYWPDSDADGYGDDAAGPENTCDGPPPGFVNNNDDCDDSNSDVFPGAPELCDGLDNDCDGALGSDEIDNDLDGFTECDGDCDDADNNNFPGNTEVCDEQDNNCDGCIDCDLLFDIYYPDVDGDGFGDANAVATATCDGPPPGFVLDDNTDCDDTNRDIYPGAPELCDGLDNDCDGALSSDEIDNDLDGFTECDGDCDDADNNNFPGNAEVCDGIDNDCDGVIDNGVTFTDYWPDSDADGYGDDAAGPENTCAGPPPGFVNNNDDCDDSNSDVFPGAPELCDGLDNDCDGALGSDEIDDDLDGYTECDGDCDDTDPQNFPGNTEVCDERDNDCDGVSDNGLTFVDYWPDLDGDGYGDSDVPAFNTCSGQPIDYVENNDDCDDADPNINPDSAEVCNGIDDDCNGAVDDGLVFDDWYVDDDVDGHGTGAPTSTCDGPPPGSWSQLGDDCDDTDPQNFPGNTEVCDERDNDCDGVSDNGLTFVDYWPDLDGDGYGDSDVPAFNTCSGQPIDYVENNDDCDDSDLNIFPGAPEICDGVDNDCDGVVDNGVTDPAGNCCDPADLDCEGFCFGNAVTDPAGVCCDPADLDCEGLCFGNTVTDPAGVCCDPADLDCEGFCFGNTVTDPAGVCCDPADLDCEGFCFGNTVTDPAGVCCDPADLDCEGFCFGNAVTDPAGVCCDPADLDCEGLCFGNTVTDPAGVCCDPADLDCEGFCFGNTVTDPAGVCCDPADLDCEGFCFGNTVTDPAGICCDPADLDCEGFCFGNAVTDPAGVCCDPADLDCEGLCFGSAGDADTDGDGVCDNFDNCLDTFNPDQLDSDTDGHGDVCDICPFDADNDLDNDGVCGDEDNCLSTANPDQSDIDGDGSGDVCDVCPFDPTDDGSDGDGVCDDIDNCLGLANPSQLDTDGDGQGNDCDVDDDNDGVADLADPDPLNPSICGDVDGDLCDDCTVGTDGFGTAPDSNPLNDGLDTDSDGLCDLGDPDDDNDGVLDSNDPDPTNPTICGDSDNDLCDDCTNQVDGYGPLADNDPLNDGLDLDGDGYCEESDCDDGNPDIFPGAPEICDGLDNDCDGAVDNGPTGCPVDCVVGPWSDWSECSETCGGGIQIRTREVLEPAQNGGAGCPTLEETRECNTDPCCELGWEIGDWTVCSASCGSGVQTRMVVCVDCGGVTLLDSDCPQPKPETSQTCNEQPCCIVEARCTDITVELDVSGNAVVNAEDADDGSFATCGLEALLIDGQPFINFGCGDAGHTFDTEIVALSLTGETSLPCPVVIEVRDDSSPIATCHDITIALDANGNAQVSPDDAGATGSDNCGIDELLIDGAPFINFGCGDAGHTFDTEIVALSLTGETSPPCPIRIEVRDDNPPTAQCQDITIALDANGNAQVSPDDAGATGSDNCGIDELLIDGAPFINFGCGDAGHTFDTEIVALSLTGETSPPCPVRIEVRDDNPPTAQCQDVTIGFTHNGGLAGTADALTIGSGSTDNCGIASMTVAPSEFTCVDIGINQVTLIVTDNSGNSNTCNAIVTLEDDIPPVAICKDITVVLDASNQACIQATDLDNGSTDNCSGLSYFLPDGTATRCFSCADLEITSMELIVTDEYGNSSTCTSIVLGLEEQVPDAVCQDITVQLDVSGQASIMPADLDGGSTDNCHISQFSFWDGGQTLPSPQFFECGDIRFPIVIGMLVEDGNGNSNTCSATVTVEDNIPPTVQCKNLTVELDANGEAMVDAADFDDGSSDNCGISGFFFGDGSTAINVFCSDVGTQALTVEVETCDGVVCIRWPCSATMSVVDNTPPIALCQDITVLLDENGEACITGQDLDNGSGDACGLAWLQPFGQPIFDPSCLRFTCAELGTNNATLGVMDNNGNFITCDAVVTVDDILPPVINCEDITVQLDDNGQATVLASDVLQPPPSDNCGIASVTPEEVTFTCSDIGINSLSFQVQDIKALISLCTATVTVEDNIPSVFQCHDVTIQLDANGNGTVNASEWSDDSGQQLPVFGGLPFLYFEDGSTSLEFNCSNVGVSTIVIFADVCCTDGDCFTASCEASLTVDDNIPPVALCQDITIQLDGNGNAAIEGEDLDGGSNDACGWTDQHDYAHDWAVSQSNFTCSDVGPNTVTLTVVDVNANSSTCTAFVTVEDNIPPTISCPANIEINDACGPQTVNFTALPDDNCGGLGVVYFSNAVVVESGEVFPLGTTIVTAVATDGASNESSCSFSVTLQDLEPPVAVCQDITVQLDETGTATITAADINNGSTDNCDDVNLLLNDAGFIEYNCTNVGGNAVTISVTDGSGNFDVCTATVTVIDNNPPTALCQDVTVVVDGSLIAGDVDAGSSDECGLSGLELDISSFDCSDVGDHTVTLTVTDVNGNSSLCTATATVGGTSSGVSIVQTELPEFCQGEIVVLTAVSNIAISYLWSTGETTPSIEVAVNGTYSVTIATISGCISTASHTVSGIGPGALLSSYTILGTDEVHLHGGNLVASGGVGVTKPGKKAKFHKGTTVNTFAKASIVEITGGSTVASVILAPAGVTLPVFHENPYNSNNSITVNANAVVTLTDCVFDTLVISKNATVTFTCSNIFINELILKEGVTIHFSGSANLFINKKVKVEKNSNFNPAAEFVTMYAKDKVEVKENVSFNGNIYSKKDIHAHAKKGKTTWMNGLFIGKKIHGNNQVIWNNGSNCDPADVVIPNVREDYTVNAADQDEYDQVILPKIVSQAYPNPFTNRTIIEFVLPEEGRTVIEIINLDGDMVHRSELGVLEGSYKHTYDFVANDKLSGGIYIYRIISSKFVTAGKLLYMK